MDDKDVPAWRSSFDTMNYLEGEGEGGGGDSDRGLSMRIGFSAAPQDGWAAPPRTGLLVDFFAKAEEISQVRSPPAPSKDHDVLDLNLRTSDLAVNIDLQQFSLSNKSNQRRVQDRLLAIKKEKEATQAELARRQDENQELKNTFRKRNAEYDALHALYMKLQREQTMKNREISSEVEAMKFSEQYNGGIEVSCPYRVSSSSLAPSEEDVNDSPPPDAADKQAGLGSKRSSPSAVRETRNLQPSRSSGQNFEENLRKRTKVLIRTRAEAPKLEDGGRWKKYGQKTAKGNNNPRAYFRCNVANGCPVRKRVQRCAEDNSVLITAYEGGAHNHPLDPAAMAVASATSAAVEMILSGSTTPGKGLSKNPNSIFANATISQCQPFPSVIVDLTGAANPALHQQQRPATLATAAAAALFQVPLASSGGYSSLLQVLGQPLLGNQATSSAPPSDVVSAATAAIFKDPKLTAAFFAQINSVVHRQDDGDSQERREPSSS